MGIHAQLLGHLAKRGAAALVEAGAASDGIAYTESPPASFWAQVHGNVRLQKDQLPVLGIAITGISFVVAYVSVSYTLGGIISTLAMIEQPKSLVVSELKPVDDDSADAPLEKARLLDEEVTIYRRDPVTSSIRKTMRHLVSVGGCRARWRGFQVSIVYHLLQAVLGNLLTVLITQILHFNEVAVVIASVLSTVLLARIHMTWTHVMISTPSSLPWYRRVPRGRIYFKALLIPTLVFSVAQHLTLILPWMVYLNFGPAADADVGTRALRVAGMFGSMALLAVSLLLPATVTLTRVEASLLPDDVETIVDFDRTLGGAAVDVEGAGKINYRALYDAAWRSFDKASRIRLLKFYVKYALAMIAVVVFYAGLFAIQFLTMEGMRKAD